LHKIIELQGKILQSAILWHCYDSILTYQEILEKSIVEHFYNELVPKFHETLKKNEAKKKIHRDDE